MKKSEYRKALEAQKHEHKRRFESRKPVGMLNTKKKHEPTGADVAIDFSFV